MEELRKEYEEQKAKADSLMMALTALNDGKEEHRKAFYEIRKMYQKEHCIAKSLGYLCEYVGA